MASLRPTPSVDRLLDLRSRARDVVTALTIVVSAAALAAACAGEPPEVTNGDSELETGRAIYASNCASCHGADGGGGVGSRLNNGSMLEAYPEIQDQIDLVANGKGRMPAYAGRLDEDQLRAVVRYTREIL